MCPDPHVCSCTCACANAQRPEHDTVCHAVSHFLEIRLLPSLRPASLELASWSANHSDAPVSTFSMPWRYWDLKPSLHAFTVNFITH